jgi:hypothetical protein
MEFQHELEMKKLEIHAKLGSDPSINKTSAGFDVTKYYQLKLVPPFQEADVDKYLCTLRNVAGNLK